MYNDFASINNSEPTVSEMPEMPELDFVLDPKNFSWCCDARLEEENPGFCPACGENQ